MLVEICKSHKSLIEFIESKKINEVKAFKFKSVELYQSYLNFCNHTEVNSDHHEFIRPPMEMLNMSGFYEGFKAATGCIDYISEEYGCPAVLLKSEDKFLIGRIERERRRAELLAIANDLSVEELESALKCNNTKDRLIKEIQELKGGT